MQIRDGRPVAFTPIPPIASEPPCPTDRLLPRRPLSIRADRRPSSLRVRREAGAVERPEKTGESTSDAAGAAADKSAGRSSSEPGEPERTGESADDGGTAMAQPLDGDGPRDDAACRADGDPGEELKRRATPRQMRRQADVTFRSLLPELTKEPSVGLTTTINMVEI
jgi:hypothetical protein